MNRLQILIADDHDLIRRGVRTLLESHPDWTVVAECDTGRSAVAIAEGLHPDIAILDITMPELNGIEAARRILKSLPHTEVLMLSAHYSDQLVRDILAAGIRGFVIKSDSDRDLVTAVESLGNHKPFFTSCAAELMLNGLSPKQGFTKDVSRSLGQRLTSREREVAQLLSEGKSSKEVALELSISVKTAEAHRANIMSKLEIHSVTQLVRYAIRNQIVEI